MPTFRHGKAIRVFHGGYDVSTFLKDVSIPRTSDVAETTAFGSTVKTFVLGTTESKASASGMFSYNTSAPNADIDNIMSAAFGQEAFYPVSVAFDSGVATAGKTVVCGQVLNSGYNISGSVSDIVGITADWQYSGPLRNALTLNAVDTNIALAGVTVQGTGIDCSALLPTGATQFLLGGMAVLHVFSNTVNAACTIRVQSSNLIGGTYVDEAVFTVVPTATVQGEAQELARGTVVDKFLRYQIVTTGTGNIKMLCTFAPSGQ